eukprot:gene32825-42200_t
MWSTLERHNRVGNACFHRNIDSSAALEIDRRAHSDGGDGDEGVDVVAAKKSTGTTGPKRETFAFSVHNRIFDEADQAIALTMPLHRLPASLSVPPRRPASKSWHRPRVSDDDEDANDDDDDGGGDGEGDGDGGG